MSSQNKLSDFARLIQQSKGIQRTQVLESNQEPKHTDVMLEALGLLSVPDKKKQTTQEISLEGLSKEVKDLRSKVSNTQQVTSGSGEVRILRMDDVDNTTVKNNSILVYDASTKLFVGVDYSAHTITRPTKLVTTNYTVIDTDYYIGVNAPIVSTITLQTNVVSGRQIVIKDESGLASLVPIKILGNIDNDPNGLVLQINNGSVTLIYRNGWRII